jgi:hypothetical protein
MSNLAGPERVSQTKHTTKLNTQSQDEDSSIVSNDGPSLEFLKSVEKSVELCNLLTHLSLQRMKVLFLKTEKVI